MIGDTASISLLTGLPGAGKSLRLAEAITKRVEAGDHVYACNIDGLKIKGVTPWEDATKWRELPSGAILFVDEAQVFFPARTSGAVPDAVIMNKIRHDGIRLVLATQQPNYLDAYLRGLVGKHEHLLRRDGRQESFLFSDNQVMDNVRGKLAAIKRSYDHFVYKFNPKFFECYDSAQTHTVKWVMPALMKKALIVGPIAILMCVGAWSYVFGDALSSKAKAEAAAATAAAGGSQREGAAADPPGRSADKVPAEPGDYALALVPRLSHQPWSAPIFDSTHEQAKAQPEVYCVASGAGEGANGEAMKEGCSCMTEQGTRYELDNQTCYALVEQGGSYNPFKEPARDTQPRNTEQEPSKGEEPQPSDMPPSVAPTGSGQIAYGEMGKYGDHALAGH